MDGPGAVKGWRTGNFVPLRIEAGRESEGRGSMDDGRRMSEDRKIEIRKENRGKRLKAKGSGHKAQGTRHKRI